MKKYRYKKVHSLLDDTEWFYAVNVPNPADHVYCDNKDPDSRGYGGSKLDFPLVDGTICTVKGPWHGSPDSLYDHTNIDLRNFHFSRLEIYHAIPVLNAEYRRNVKTIDGQIIFAKWPRIYWVRGQVIYKETNPVLGNFWRHEVLGQQLADAMNLNVYVDHYTEGGSSLGMKTPGREMHPLAIRELQHKVVM